MATSDREITCILHVWNNTSAINPVPDSKTLQWSPSANPVYRLYLLRPDCQESLWGFSLIILCETQFSTEISSVTLHFFMDIPNLVLSGLRSTCTRNMIHEFCAERLTFPPLANHISLLLVSNISHVAQCVISSVRACRQKSCRHLRSSSGRKHRVV